MEQRIFHGHIELGDFARSLVGHFNMGNYRVDHSGNDKHMVIQISTSERANSGGRTALTVTLQKVEDGVSIYLGEQAWLGVAASLGMSVFSALHNPFKLIGRLDDIAQDIESLSLSDQVWNVIEETAKTMGLNHELSERLRRVVCDFCLSANPVGEASCIACGAPLGNVQPATCKNCGYSVITGEGICPNCGKLV